DVQLNKVKFGAKHEYEYVANFKVLQTAFDKHKLDKPVFSALAMEDYDVLKELGDGSFGTVIQAKHKHTGQMSLRLLPTHSQVICLLEAFLLPQTRDLHFVFEYMEGNLYQLIKDRKGKKLGQRNVQSIMYQMLQGVYHIHSHGLFHRDLKPENILISTRKRQKVFNTSSKGNDYIKGKRYEILKILGKSTIDVDINERLIQYWDDGKDVCKKEKGKNNWKEDKWNCYDDVDDEDVEYLVKVGDFGLAREIKSRPPYTEYVSTRWYRAPEVLLRSPSYSAPVDLWAVGVIMAEVCTLKPLFPGQSEIDQMFKICEVLGSPTPVDDAVGQIGGMGGGGWKEGVKLAKSKGFCFPDIPPQNIAKRLPRFTSPTFIQLLLHLLRYNPRQRLTALDALLHPYFTESNLHFVPTEITDTVKLSKVGQERKRKTDGFYGLRKLGYGTENKKGAKYSWCKGEELGEREGKEHLDKDVVLIPLSRSLPSFSPLSAMENNRSCLLSLNIDAAHDINLGDYSSYSTS
ncbi:3481_t:CDS:2, partial [Paraglomus occultum]